MPQGTSKEEDLQYKIKTSSQSKQKLIKAGASLSGHKALFMLSIEGNSHCCAPYLCPSIVHLLTVDGFGYLTLLMVDDLQYYNAETKKLREKALLLGEKKLLALLADRSEKELIKKEVQEEVEKLGEDFARENLPNIIEGTCIGLGLPEDHFKKLLDEDIPSRKKIHQINQELLRLASTRGCATVQVFRWRDWLESENQDGQLNDRVAKIRFRCADNLKFITALSETAKDYRRRYVKNNQQEDEWPWLRQKAERNSEKLMRKEYYHIFASGCIRSFFLVYPEAKMRSNNKNNKSNKSNKTFKPPLVFSATQPLVRGFSQVEWLPITKILHTPKNTDQAIDNPTTENVSIVQRTHHRPSFFPPQALTNGIEKMARRLSLDQGAIRPPSSSNRRNSL